MNKTAKDLIYLLTCAVNGLAPDTARAQAMDMEKLYQLAKAHTLRAAVFIALRSAGVQDRSFQQAYNKAVRKNVMLDVERTAIFERFEQQGIWYMSLKGSILKELYPENGMREMADNDVLYGRQVCRTGVFSKPITRQSARMSCLMWSERLYLSVLNSRAFGICR